MSLNALRKGSHVTIGPTRFLILQKVSDNSWQLQNTTTGEWCKFTEDELLDQFSRNELVFDRDTGDRHSGNHHGSTHLDRVLSTYPPHLVMIAQNRVQYLREIDRLQPIAITGQAHLASERVFRYSEGITVLSEAPCIERRTPHGYACALIVS